jgi:aspartyl-tRNA(Asn)/glutamyl-tRNA(Gln) amidotransferase subunit A
MLNKLTLAETIKKLKAKEFSHKELYLDIEKQIQESNKTCNIYLSLDKQALQKAEKLLDTPLAGAPIAVKDNFLTKELPTTAASNVLKGFMPPYESTVTKKLMQSGGVIIGKTNMDAWAHGSSTENSDFGPTKNPRNVEYLPGGSSGGSAAAVAADACIAAIGSETAGSIRQPSSWCGVVGLKPTYGRVSRYGVVSMASSTDSPGSIGKTVEDVSLLYEQIAGPDDMDATTPKKAVPSVLKNLRGGVKGMNIGICYTDHPDLKDKKVTEQVLEAGKLFEKQGAQVTIIPVSEKPEKGKILKHDYAIGVYTVVQRSEVSSTLARYDGVRFGQDRSFLGTEAKRRIMLGTFTLSKGYADKYYVKAQQVRNLYLQNFKELFGTYDVLISPTTPSYAERLGASMRSPMFGELEDMLLEPTSISGLPGISVPCYKDEKTNLYLGMNIVAPWWQEEKMIQAAQVYESETPWNSWRTEV